MSRHGRGHRISPSELNFRANIYGFKSLGVERIISLSAVGSLKEEHAAAQVRDPRSVLRPHARPCLHFFRRRIWWRTSASPIRCARSFPKWCIKPAFRPASDVAQGGTYLCMEGPAFSTKAESNVYRSWGMDVIGMTNLQEAKLAREAEICYVTIAMVTDYDCWHEEHDAVTVTDILANLAKNAENACKVVAASVASMPDGARMQMRIGARPRLDHRSQGRARNDAQEAGAAGWKIPRLSSSAAAQTAGHCLASRPWPEHLLDGLLARGGDRALFRIVVESAGGSVRAALCAASMPTCSPK